MLLLRASDRYVEEMPGEQRDCVAAARAEIDRVVQHGFSDDDLAIVRAAPPHDPSLPRPPGTVLIEDPEGILRAVPVPHAFQAALPDMFPDPADPEHP